MTSRHFLLSSGLMAIALSGCGGGGGSRIDTVPLVAGDDCPTGGVQFNAGIDSDGNGELTGDEITESVIVCNGSDGTPGEDGDTGATGSDGSTGADGATALARTTTLAPGEGDCDFGGTMVEIGLDNGDGGETADDGVLGDGEVDSSQSICDGEPAFIPDSIDEPGGTAGGSSFVANGGNGTGGNGGDGGEAWISASYADSAHVKVFTTGAVDASFDLPTTLPDTSGARAISTDTTVLAFDSVGAATGLSDGDLFRATSNPNLFIFDATSGEHGIVDELVIDDGATLTMNNGEGGVSLSLDALVVNGTLRAETTSGTSVSFNINSDFIHVGATGLIDGSNTTSPGQVSLDADVAIVEGTIDASALADGYDAADINVYGEYGIYSTGQLVANGAPGSGEGGGEGGDVDLSTDSDSFIYNSAFIDAHGGNDATSDGGDGGSVYMGGESGVVTVKNSGDIDAHGGNGGGEAGGDGGYVELWTYDAPVSNSGDIDLHGGDASAGTAGDGGDFDVWSEPEGNYGRIDVSGNIDLVGGNGDTGGDGGNLDVYHDDDVYGHVPVALYGFSSFEVRGGNSNESAGGDGGEYWMYHGSGSSSIDPGGVVNYADADVSGGDSGPGFDAGEGGSVWLECGEAGEDATCFVYSRANYIGPSGGGGGEAGGADVGFWASDYVDHEGNVDASSVDSTNDNGSYGGELEVDAVYGDVTWSGNVDLDGADAVYNGGSGGECNVEGAHVTWSGDFSGTGGNATDSGEGGGGDGTWAYVQSFYGGSTITIGDGDVTGGTGVSSDGEIGGFVVDGFDIEDSF